jgi:hypothetical protein
MRMLRQCAAPRSPNGHSSAFALLAPLYFAVGEWRLAVGVAFAMTAAVGLARLGDQLSIQSIFMGMLVVGLVGLGAALALIA